MKSLLRLTLILTLALTACGSGSGPSASTPAPAPTDGGTANDAGSITLSQTSSYRYDGYNLGLALGESVSGTYLSGATWTSSNPAAVRVTAGTGGSFTVTGLAAGTSTVRGTLGTRAAEMKVTVTAPATTPAPTPAPTVSSVNVSTTTLALNPGASQTVTAAVQGTGSFNPGVTWTTSNAGVANVDGAGRVTAVAVGTATVTATSVQDASKRASLSVTVTAPAPTIMGVTVNPGSLSLTAGGSQSVTASVQGTGSFNPGVTWTTSNAGVANVDGAGRVTAVAAGTATITATSVQDADQRASLTATVTAPAPTPTPAPAPSQDAFDITVVFPSGTTLTAGQKAAFTNAATRWSQVIAAGLPDVAGVTLSTGQKVTVDDVTIVASGTPIDGPGQILGQAGPRQVRPGTTLPLWGEMEFDSADLDSMEANGTLAGVIMHEMGHVLGIGTLWDRYLTVNATTCTSATKVQYSGANGLGQYKALNGQAAGVPVEDQYGEGTKCGHWKESVFQNELMTGFANKGSMPLSRITLGALADLGYSVNYAAADAYTIPSVSAQSVDPGTQIHERLITPDGIVDPGH